MIPGPLWRPSELFRADRRLYGLQCYGVKVGLENIQVAEDFVAAREDEHGVLILSRFTGASRELRDALIVNPYDIEELADAIYRALNMAIEEQTIRMRECVTW